MSPFSEPIVLVRNLTKRFGDFTAVDGVSFDIRQGEILGLLGPNGAGKTTTIQMLLGLITPTAGEIRVFGLPFDRHREEILGRIVAEGTAEAIKAVYGETDLEDVFLKLARTAPPGVKHP